MLNEIHIEGVIAARWRYGEAEFVRIAVYSDPGAAAGAGTAAAAIGPIT